MKKTILLLLILSASAHASMLWNIDNGISLYYSNKDSLEYFKSYINSNPNDEEGYFWLAKAYQKQNSEKQALSAFKRAYSFALNNKNIDKIEFENNEYNNLEDYFDMAANYYENGNYKEALNYANMMLQIDPDCSSAYFIKAKISHVEGNEYNAIENLNKAILLNNSLLETKLAKTLGIVKIPELSKKDCIIYAQKAYYKGDIDSTIKYLTRNIELDKDNIDSYVMLINCYLKNKNVKEAKRILSLAPESENNVSLLLSESDIEYYTNKYSQNYENILLKAYGINPNNKALLLKLSNLYLYQKDYHKAHKYFEILINVDDSLYEAYFGEIYSLIKLNNLDKAQSLLKTAISLNKNTSEIPYLLSLICSAQGEYQDAFDYIKAALKKDNNPYYLIEAGKLSYLLGKYDNSIKFLTPVVKLSDAREYLILSYLKKENYSKIKELYTEAGELDKKRLSYKYYLYKTYKTNSKELYTILKQKPDELQDYIDLARICLLEGKKDLMNKVLNNAIKKYGEDPQINSIKQELQYQIN